jgi:hypothetical protein
MVIALGKFATKVFGKKFLLSVFKGFALFSRKFAAFAHRLQLKYEWGAPPQPEWFDHYVDQFGIFRQTRNPLWVERGTFGLLAIDQGARVLELCCGDGFNSYHFYSIRCSHIIAVDFDKDAINGRKFLSCSNV